MEGRTEKLWGMRGMGNTRRYFPPARKNNSIHSKRYSGSPMAMLLCCPQWALEHPCTLWDLLLWVYLAGKGSVSLLHTHQRVPVNWISVASHLLPGTNCQFRKEAGERSPQLGLSLPAEVLREAEDTERKSPLPAPQKPASSPTCCFFPFFLLPLPLRENMSFRNGRVGADFYL